MKRIVIIGATSGIGLEVARLFLKAGWMVGAAARREELLEALRMEAPAQVVTRRIDINDTKADEELRSLIEELGGVDIYLHASGIGYYNPTLDSEKERSTATTNGVGFVRMVRTAYDYMASHGGGRLAAISSIAGTKGLGMAPAYSATKRMQNCYLDALAQHARLEKTGVKITDIRPGFVRTPLLADRPYPLLMEVEPVARAIFRALMKGRRRVVIDTRYRLLVALWRLIPQWLWEHLPIKN